jgi:hypothetical protein
MRWAVYSGTGAVCAVHPVDLAAVLEWDDDDVPLPVFTDDLGPLEAVVTEELPTVAVFSWERPSGTWRYARRGNVHHLSPYAL